MTASINNNVADNTKFASEIMNAFVRYQRRDWGDLCKTDKQMNDDAVNNGTNRILAAYKTFLGKVYIITEYDRSATTILFADEY